MSNGWLSRMRAGLARSSKRMAEGIASIFSRRAVDPQSLEDLEDLLVSADVGPTNAARLVELVAKQHSKNQDSVSPTAIRQTLAEEIVRILTPVARSLADEIKSSPARPFVTLILGVNGCGKTTTVGKLAKLLNDRRYSVLVIAGDTFRAAAIEQLTIWVQRAGCSLFTRHQGADAAGVVFEGCQQAMRERYDVVLVDTGGRVHNRVDLMAQIQKMIRAMKKLNPEFPHAMLLVLDASTGQNALNQVEAFSTVTASAATVPAAAVTSTAQSTVVDAAGSVTSSDASGTGSSNPGLSGLILTKLDGTAKGGVLLALVERFGLPVYAVGVGEGIDDLRSFEPDQFARSLMGLD